VLAELLGFRERGAWVALLAPEHAEIFHRARASGIDVEPLDVSKAKYPLSALCLRRWLMANNVQVVNTHSSRDGWLVGAAARLARVPLIIRSRHIEVDYPKPWVSRHAFTTFADHVVTTSERISNNLISTFNLDEGCVSTIPTGTDLIRFSDEGPKAELFDKTMDERPLVGMVSVLRSWKGHSVFLEAAKLLKIRGVGVRFVIVGEGPMREEILKLISAHELSEDVLLAGFREDIPAVLRALDLLAIPSTNHEGIPQIGLQALACRTPVVGSDAGGIPEIIRHGETGRIVAAGDAELLANAIAETLMDDKGTTRMTDNGRVMVEREHGIDHMLDQLERIYADHLINPHS